MIRRCMMILNPVLCVISGSLLIVCGLDVLSDLWFRLPSAGGGFHWRYLAVCLVAMILAAALMIAVLIAIIIVLAMNLVGSLLISALIIFPALSAMRIFKSFQGVIIGSAVFSVICAVLGMVTSILFGTPVGSTIVAVDFAGFLIFAFIGFVKAG